MTTEEGNKLIAKFMGAIYRHKYGFEKQMGYEFDMRPYSEDKTVTWWDECYLKFNNSWDWLMPVVEKIENNYQVQVHIQNDACWIKKSFKPYFDFSVISDNSKIEAVWLAVIEFAKFHNRQNSQLTENQNVTQP